MIEEHSHTLKFLSFWAYIPSCLGVAFWNEGNDPGFQSSEILKNISAKHKQQDHLYPLQSFILTLSLLFTEKLLIPQQGIAHPEPFPAA